MRRLFRGRPSRALLPLVLLVAGLVGPLAAQTAPPSLPVAAPAPISLLDDVERLQAENLKLRAQVLDLQRALAQTQLEQESARLNADRQALESAFRVRLKPGVGQVFDWQTLAFKPPDPAPIPPPPAQP